MNPPTNAAELANYQAAMALATYLYILAMYLSTGIVIAAAFKKWKTAMAFGTFYGMVIFLLPYKISAILGLIITIVCISSLIVYFIKAREKPDAD